MAFFSSDVPDLDPLDVEIIKRAVAATLAALGAFYKFCK
jgi:hypothetical protein